MSILILSDDAVLGAKVKRDHRNWYHRYLVEVKTRDIEPSKDYIPDFLASHAILVLPCDVLGAIVRKATAENTSKLGYRGVRSNSGETAATIYTAVRNKIEDEFGPEVIWSNAFDHETEVRFRGIIYREDVVAAFDRELNILILKLINM